MWRRSRCASICTGLPRMAAIRRRPRRKEVELGGERRGRVEGAGGEEWMRGQVGMRVGRPPRPRGQASEGGTPAWARGSWRHGASAPRTVEKKGCSRKPPRQHLI